MLNVMHRQNDFDSFLVRNNHFATPKRTYSPHVAPDNRIFPMVQTAKNNPQVSPKRRPAMPKPMQRDFQGCQIHPDVPASFQTFDQGQRRIFCQNCAGQLAAEGQVVQKIVGQDRGPLNPARMSGALLVTPRGQQPEPQLISPIIESLSGSYRNNPVYEEVTRFLSQTAKIQSEISKTIETYSELEKHYESQIHFVNDCLVRLQTMVRETREKLVEGITLRQKKLEQVAALEVDFLESENKELDDIKQDIESNAETIITQIKYEVFRDCMDENAQKLAFLSHKLEENADKFEGYRKMLASYPSADCLEETLAQQLSDFITAFDLDSRAGGLSPSPRLPIEQNQRPRELSQRSQSGSNIIQQQHLQPQPMPRQNTHYGQPMAQHNQMGGQYQAPFPLPLQPQQTRCQQPVSKQHPGPPMIMGRPYAGGQPPAADVKPPFRTLFQSGEEGKSEHIVSPQFKKI